MKKQGSKFYQKKAFRYILLAVMLVSLAAGLAVQQGVFTRAGDQETPVEDVTEVVEATQASQDEKPVEAEPEEQTEEPAPQEEAPQEVTEPEVTAEPEPEPEPTEAPQATPEPTEAPSEAVETVEETAKPASAQEDSSFRQGYAYALANAPVFEKRRDDAHEILTLPEDAVVKVTSRIEQEKDGVESVWMAVRLMAVNEEDELEQISGYVQAWYLQQVPTAEYERRTTLTEKMTEEDPEWIETDGELTVVRVPFELSPKATAAPAKEEPVDAPEETPDPEAAEVEPTEEPVVEENVAPQPRVEISYEYEGELTVGTKITLVAELFNMPEGEAIHLQWKNNATGDFEPVHGANGTTFTFEVNETNVSWKWIMEVTIGEGA